MTTPAKIRRHWSAKLQKLADAQQHAHDALMIGIHEAREAGLSQRDVGEAIGSHPTGVAAKARKGEEILKARKGESRP